MCDTAECNKGDVGEAVDGAGGGGGGASKAIRAVLHFASLLATFAVSLLALS